MNIHNNKAAEKTAFKIMVLMVHLWRKFQIFNCKLLTDTFMIVFEKTDACHGRLRQCSLGWWHAILASGFACFMKPMLYNNTIQIIKLS